jgi:hypothetical protein
MKPAPITRLFPVLFLCLTLASCTGLFKNYGQINPSSETTGAFEKYMVNPQYRYYISGSDLYPNALMGLHRDYRLDPSTLWKEVEMTPERMKETVLHMKTKAFELMQFPHGFDILDNNGRPIGVWYSILTARTYVRMEDNGTVMIDTPELETYIKFEQREDTNSN